MSKTLSVIKCVQSAYGLFIPYYSWMRVHVLLNPPCIFKKDSFLFFQIRLAESFIFFCARHTSFLPTHRWPYVHLSIWSPVMLAASTTKNLSVIMTHKKLRIEQTYWKVLISLRWILNITFSDHSISALLKPSWSSYSWTAVKTRKSLTLSCQRYKVITINLEKLTIFPSTPQSTNWRLPRPQLCFDINKTILIAQLKFLLLSSGLLLNLASIYDNQILLLTNVKVRFTLLLHSKLLRNVQ